MGTEPAGRHPGPHGPAQEVPAISRGGRWDLSDPLMCQALCWEVQGPRTPVWVSRQIKEPNTIGAEAIKGGRMTRGPGAISDNWEEVSEKEALEARSGL